MTERQRAQQIKRLEACLAKPENRECFDCATLRPRWASTNLGIFICMRCAGIHRSLGTHISKVKSINMDLWDEDMIRNCETIGNGPEGRFRYEANIPATHVKPKMNADNRDVERIIRLKFESKLYYPRPDQQRPDASAALAQPAAQSSAPAQPSTTATPQTQAQPATRVVQAVAVEAPKAEEPDLFGEFAQARVTGQGANFAEQAKPAAAPAASGAATSFFDSAPAPAQQPPTDIFAGATGGPVQTQQPPRPTGNVDFFGGGQQQQQQQTDFFGAPQAAPVQQQQQFTPAPAPQQHQQQQQQGGMDFFSAATGTAAPVMQSNAGGFQSMYQRQNNAPAKAPQAGPDPFSALAAERPRTPPKQRHEAHHAAQAQNHGAQGGAPDPFADFAAAPKPQAKPAQQQKDAFADFF